MKKGEKRLLIFEIIVLLILLLNSFVWGELVGIKLVLFLGILLFIFKLVFGFEKSYFRTSKVALLDTIIFLLAFLIVYYLFGVLIGFARVGNYFTLNGLRDYLVPVIGLAVIREIMRYNLVIKAGDNKLVILISIIMFIFFDICGPIYYGTFNNAMNIFKFVALTVMPSISFNIYATYVCKKAGYKSVILYALVMNLYQFIIPIIPNASEYLTSIIRVLLPLILLYRLYTSIKNESDEQISRDYNKKDYAFLVVSAVIVMILVYFSSGYFSFHGIAIASGSMSPNINRGDVVIVKKTKDYENINVGDVIAYEYHGIIVVHRVNKKLKVENEYFFYTKGDVNDFEDNYTIKEDMIEGKVKFRIPYLGVPTVWLNELWEE